VLSTISWGWQISRARHDDDMGQGIPALAEKGVFAGDRMDEYSLKILSNGKNVLSRHHVFLQNRLFQQTARKQQSPREKQ
jgi:hypothetical protein